MVCRPLAAQLSAVGGDQTAPDTMLADVPVPQRQLQALGTHRAAGADGDGRGRLVPGPGCVETDWEPFVGGKAAVSAPGVPGDPGPQRIIGQRRFHRCGPSCPFDWMCKGKAATCSRTSLASAAPPHIVRADSTIRVWAGVWDQQV